VRISSAEQVQGRWVIAAVGDGFGVCPSCGSQSSHRHGWHERHLQDLPAQGAGVTVKLRMQRWQCRSKSCERQTFTEQLPEIAAPMARRTARAAELVHLFGHGVGGRPGERLMKRIGMPTSDDTILRSLKQRAKERRTETGVRVVGIDDWAWRKGSTYGTIVVDLERREVIDVLPDRSAGSRQAGSSSIRTSRSSVAIAAARLPRAHGKARRKHVKSPTVSIFCRTCARPFRCNSAARVGRLLVPCCPRTSTTRATR